jgi:hypothetical protein
LAYYGRDGGCRSWGIDGFFGDGALGHEVDGLEAVKEWDINFPVDSDMEDSEDGAQGAPSFRDLDIIGAKDIIAVGVADSVKDGGHYLIH